MPTGVSRRTSGGSGTGGPSRPLPIEARRALWTRLWERLLSPPPDRTSRPDAPRDEPAGEGFASGRQEGEA